MARAINNLDRSGGLTAIAASRKALVASRIPDDDRLAVELQIDYLQFGLDLHTGDPKQAAAHFQGMVSRFSPRCPSPVAEAQRSRLLFQLLVIGEIECIAKANADQVYALLASIEEKDRTTEVWHYASLWACMRGDTELLDQAYECMLERQRVAHYGFYWQRVRLLHRLGNGTAQRQDIEALLAECNTPGLLRDFERRIMPLVKRAGLDSARLEASLDVRKTGSSPAKGVSA